MQNSASMKHEPRKRTCTIIRPCQKRVQSDAMYILCFLYILQSHVYLYTQFQKSSWPGKLLNFTEIHRKYYKKLSFSFETNLSHALWFEKFRIWFSRPRTTRGTTLLYIQGTIVIACCCVNIIFVRLLNTRIYLLLNQLVKKEFCLLFCGNLSLPKSISLLSISFRTYTVLNINLSVKKNQRKSW